MSWCPCDRLECQLGDRGFCFDYVEVTCVHVRVRSSCRIVTVREEEVLCWVSIDNEYEEEGKDGVCAD